MSKPTRLVKGFVPNKPSERRQVDAQYDEDFDSDSESDEHVAHTAAASGNIPLLIHAVQNDPGILEQRDKDGHTPLTHAVNGKHLTAVKRLVKMGADVNVQDSQGRTYLSLAAYQGWYDGVVYLLRKGAKPDITDRSGRTPLHAATYDKDTRCLIALLKRLSQEEINSRDKEAMTALHWSAFHDRPDHVRELLHRDAEICAQDIDGKTALHWAAQNGSRGCCVLLAEHDRGHGLLKQVDSSGKTPMHLAAAAGKPQIIKELAMYDPDMCEAQDNEERTPLHWATAMGHLECVRVLLKHGVTPNPFDQDGMAPVEYAKNAGHKQCVLLLEEAMRLRRFQANNRTLSDNRSREKNGSEYFRGTFSKRGKNGAKQSGNEQAPDKSGDKLPSLNVTGQRKVIQGAQTDDYDAEISRLFKDQKVTVSSKNKGDHNTDLVTNGFEDAIGSVQTPDKTHHGKRKKKKRHRKEERMSYTSSPNTVVTPTTWDEDRSTGNNSMATRTTHLSPLRGSVSPRISQSPMSGRDMLPTPRRLGELVPIRPSSLTNNVPLHQSIAILRDDRVGESRSPTPPPVFRNINKKKALPDISPLAQNFNTMELDRGITTDQNYQEHV